MLKSCLRAFRGGVFLPGYAGAGGVGFSRGLGGVSGLWNFLKAVHSRAQRGEGLGARASRQPPHERTAGRTPCPAMQGGGPALGPVMD